MKLIVHNLHKGSNRVYEGDTKSVFRALEKDFPWACKHINEDLDRKSVV